MRPSLVVVSLPSLQLPLCIRQIIEPVHDWASVAKRAMPGFQAGSPANPISQPRNAGHSTENFFAIHLANRSQIRIIVICILTGTIQ